MTFRVGQKVTQIRRFNWVGALGETLPKFGIVYTVRAINHDRRGQSFLHFIEINNRVNAYIDGSLEMDFLAEFFRPIVERKTSIEIFTRMLNPSRENMDA